MTFDQAKGALWALVDGWPGLDEDMVGNKLTINIVKHGDVDKAYAKMLPEYKRLQAKGLAYGHIT